MLPWVVSLVPALWHTWRRGAPGFDARRFLLLWCAVVFVFFSASSSKLIPYVLPLFPALSLLVGDYLRVAGRGVLLAQAALAVFSAVLAFRGMRASAIVSLAFGGLTLSQLALTGHESLAPSLSAYHIVHKIRDQLKPDTPFYFVDTFDHTALFYLGRQVTMVAVKDELVDPIERTPRDFLPDAAAFARAWEADGDAFAMFNAADLEPFLKAHPVPMRIVAQDPRRVIVRKP